MELQLEEKEIKEAIAEYLQARGTLPRYCEGQRFCEVTDFAKSITVYATAAGAATASIKDVYTRRKDV